MKSIASIRTALVLTLLAGFFLALAGPAVAGCRGVCVNVAPPGEFCRRCMDAGHETGAACRDLGACGCIYLQCLTSGDRTADAGIGEVPSLSAGSTPLSKADTGQCSATEPAPAESPAAGDQAAD